jgi:hypothetical protein
LPINRLDIFLSKNIIISYKLCNPSKQPACAIYFFAIFKLPGIVFLNICHNIVGRVFGFPFLLWQKQHPANGKVVLGKYIRLAVTYSNDDKVLSLESCNACADNVVFTRKVNIEKVILFITVTLPAILIYVGVKN